MKLTDEILNKYIDRELSAAEIRELKETINSEPESLDKLKALQMTDDILRELEFDAAPQNFTEKIMRRLNVVYSEKPAKNYFIKTVFTLFGLGFLGVFLFGITQVSAGSSNDEKGFLQNLFHKAGEVIPSLHFSFSISSELLMLIASILVLVTLIATYIIINSHKAFKDNIENLSH